MLLNQLNNAIAMLKKMIEDMANKGGNIKKLKALVKRLQRMLEDHLNAGGQFEDDPMFAKRPAFGWSCASCDKDVMNMYGKHADFNAWNKMP